MALKNTTFRLSDETRDELSQLSDEMEIQSGELKRRVVRMGLEAIRAELNGAVDDGVNPALAGLIGQQKKLSEMMERQIAQAEKLVERQKSQAETVMARLHTQQAKLTDAIEDRVNQAEKALDRQRTQVESFFGNIMTQQRKLSEQVKGHLPGFVRRGRDADSGNTETSTVD